MARTSTLLDVQTQGLTYLAHICLGLDVLSLIVQASVCRRARSSGAIPSELAAVGVEQSESAAAG